MNAGKIEYVTLVTWRGGSIWDKSETVGSSNPSETSLNEVRSSRMVEGNGYAARETSPVGQI